MELIIMAPLAFILALVTRRKEALRMHWAPDRHTWMAIIVGLIAFALSCLLLAVPPGSIVHSLLLFACVWTICGFALPWGYALFVERSGAESLGLTRKRWKLSLSLNLILGGLFLTVLITQADWVGIKPRVFWAGTLVLITGNLYELFLYYGFIHLRLERSFGVIPAILGTAALYALWHVGSELPLVEQPLLSLGKLFLVGVMYQSVFSVTRNLLTIWPFFVGGGVLIDFVLDIGTMDAVARAWPWAIGVLFLMTLIGLGYFWAEKRECSR